MLKPNLSNFLQNVRNKPAAIRRHFQRHILYIQLLVILSCIALAAALMQAGSLFLLDYMPSSQSTIHKIYQHKALWQHELDVAKSMSHADMKNSINLLSRNQLDTTQGEFFSRERNPNSEVGRVLQQLKEAQAEFVFVLRQESGVQVRLDAAFKVLNAYDNAIGALQKEAEVKQSVVSLLQLVSMVLVLSCVAGIALAARRVLVDRLDRLESFAPDDLLVDVDAGADEFSRLELVTHEMSAQLQGFKAEVEWASRTSSESTRRMVNSLDFLFSFVALIRHTDLSEVALRRMLNLLERALNANNAALIFSESDVLLAVDRAIFSHHRPQALDDDMFDGMVGLTPVSYLTEEDGGVRQRCLAAQFSSSSGGLGVLKVEADEDRLFDERDVQLLEVAAQLLSMVMGVHGREQEVRRVALLEERSAIARELHDSLAQSLSFMKIQIARLQSKVSKGAASDEILAVTSELREGLNTAYQELRELLSTFRVHMDVRGLGFAIQSAIDEYSQRSGLSITLDNRLVNCRLTVNEEFHILHVVREALSNIVRHSGASNVDIRMIMQANGEVNVAVDDDGIGYTPNDDGLSHYGQTIMQERAFILGGSVSVTPRRRGGTRVRLTFRPKHVHNN